LPFIIGPLEVVAAEAVAALTQLMGNPQTSPVVAEVEVAVSNWVVEDPQTSPVVAEVVAVVSASHSVQQASSGGLVVGVEKALGALCPIQLVEDLPTVVQE